MVITENALQGDFLCRETLSHVLKAVLSLEIFANMDQKIQAAIILRRARQGDLTRPWSNQYLINGEGEGRRTILIHIGGFSYLHAF